MLSEQQEHDKKIGGMEKKNASDREALNGGVYFKPRHSALSAICFRFFTPIANRACARAEMLRRIKETKLTLLAMTQDTLHPTTKRTQQENEQMTTELAYQVRIPP